jgi:hypothetical protein
VILDSYSGPVDLCRQHTFSLPAIENVHILIPVERFENIVHMIPQVHYCCLHNATSVLYSATMQHCRRFVKLPMPALTNSRSARGELCSPAAGGLLEKGVSQRILQSFIF